MREKVPNTWYFQAYQKTQETEKKKKRITGQELGSFYKIKLRFYKSLLKILEETLNPQINRKF